MGRCIRFAISRLTASSLRRTRFESVCRVSLNRPDFRVFPQMCVNPRNWNVSGLPSPRAARSRAAYRPNSISRFFSAFSSKTYLREPVAKVSPELLGVFPMLKAHHEVVSEPHDDNVTARVPSPPLVSPQVQDVVRVDVPEQRRSRCPLRNALIERRPRPIFNDPRGQPLLNQPQDPPIRDPVLQELQKPLMVEAGEVIAEISVEHPVHVLPHDPGSERIQRVMRAAPRPKPV